MISVIVTTYNSGKTLKETLDSIYDQTYKDIELIISDDGSKDNTVAISKKWLNSHSARFSKVKLLESENGGVAINCNRGILAAAGDYIQIIAGDDILLPDALITKWKYAKEHNSTVVFCKTKPFGKNPEKVKKMEKFCERGYKIISMGYENQKKAILEDNYIAGPSGGFFNADFIKKIGFDERYPMMEDYPFIYHYIYMGYEICMIDCVLTRYRISDNSLCMKRGTPMNLSHAKFFFNERLAEMIKEKNFYLAVRQIIKFIRSLLFYNLYRSFQLWKKLAIRE